MSHRKCGMLNGKGDKNLPQHYRCVYTTRSRRGRDVVETRSETFTLGSRSERARLVASKCGALQSAFRTRLVGGSGNGGTWGAEVYGYPQCPTDVHISVWPCGHVDMYW